MKKTITRLQYPFYLLLAAFMLMLYSVSDAQAQKEIQILNEQGIPLIQSTTQKFVQNEIIVNFLPGSISVPDNLHFVEIPNVQGKAGALQLLHDMHAKKLKKVFRFFTSRDTIRTLKSGKRVHIQDLSQVFLISFPDSINVQSMVNEFKKSPQVIYAQPNYIYTTEDVPNDPSFNLQWGLEQSTGEDINAETAWSIQKGSYDVKLGIFDSGIDYNNDDLGSAFGVGWKVVGGWDWINNDSNPLDDNLHGTHVAGIAGALTNNTVNGQNTGISGVVGGWGYERSTNTGNKGAQLFAMKIGDASGNINSSDAADAITEGADPSGDGWGYGIQVLNNSWGGYSYDETVRGAVNYAALMGRVFVAAKGNDDVNTLHYPSDYDGSWVISVGATDSLGNRVSTNSYSWGSNYGNGIDVTAPGYEIYSTMPTYTTSEMNCYGLSQNYDYLSGTSMATPFVSGLAALIFSQNQSLHPEDVQGIIRASVDDKGDPGYDDFYGAGRINAGRALQYMQSPWTINHYTTTGGTAVSNTGTYGAAFYNTSGALATGNYMVKRYDVRKTVSFNFSGTPYVWGRGVNASTGWSGASPNYETGFCNVTSSTQTSAELQTFVYEVWSITGSYLGWYPTTPSDVQFVYTILGIPAPLSVSISGSTYINSGQNGTWTAYPDGGYLPYTYDWYYRYPGALPKNSSVKKPPAGTWNLLGSHTQQISRTDNQDFEIKCVVTDNQSNTVTSNIIYVYVNGGLSPGTGSIVAENELIQNFPNPFNPSTEIKYALKEDGFVTIKVYDVLGRVAATLVNENKQAGFYKVSFDASNLSSGVYFYTIKTNDFIDRKKMILLR